MTPITTRRIPTDLLHWLQPPLANDTGHEKQHQHQQQPVILVSFGTRVQPPTQAFLAVVRSMLRAHTFHSLLEA